MNIYIFLPDAVEAIPPEPEDQGAERLQNEKKRVERTEEEKNGVGKTTKTGTRTRHKCGVRQKHLVYNS